MQNGARQGTTKVEAGGEQATRLDCWLLEGLGKGFGLLSLPGRAC